jgi:predicted PurR-regulated permease PerM
MKFAGSGSLRGLEDKAVLWLIVLVSIVFVWIIAPLYGAVLWAIVIAILFTPLHRKLCKTFHRPNLAALATLLTVIIIVIIPLTVMVTALVTEATAVYDKIQSGEVNFGQYLRRIIQSTPPWASQWLDRFGISSLRGVQDKLSAGLSEASKVVAVQALQIGQNTFHFLINLFVMLYLLFFLLRDGDEIYRRIRDAVPLRSEHQRALFNKFAVVIRATVKGNLVVAILQGGLGGLILWILGIQAPLLWAALMTVLSLLPAVGAAVIWLPIAIYLLATGEVWKGVVLIAYGVLVISLVDNFVRPILVGKDTKMPDYLVLISTLGGIAVLGINGFVLGPVIAAMFISVWDIFSASQQLVQTEEAKR